MNISKVKSLCNIFSNCILLIELPDISKWNIINVIDMKQMLFLCKSLRQIPDISKWNTKNVNDMSEMFFSCFSLEYLPDISKWNIARVNKLNDMFFGCSSLLSYPDISKWNKKNVEEMSFLFSGNNNKDYTDLYENYNKKSDFKENNNHISPQNIFPKIIQKKNNYFKFPDYSSLKYLPDISKWDTSKVKKNESYIFILHRN